MTNTSPSQRYLCCIKIFIIFILLELSFGQDGDIQIDPEEINTVQSHLEDEEFTELAKYNGYFRFRIAPGTVFDNWHQRSWIDKGQWQMGYRLDKYTGQGQWRLSRYAFQMEEKKIRLSIGHLRQELGQGLLFGNSFGKNKSASQPLSVFNSLFNQSTHLGAVVDNPMIGLSVTAPFSRMSHTAVMSYSGGDKIFSFNSYRKTTRTHIGGILAGSVSADNEIKMVSSVFFDIRRLACTTTGEYAFDGHRGSAVLNIYRKNSNLLWGLHFRYYPEDWSPMIGEPYSVLHGGTNETGLMGIIRYRFSAAVMTSWLELFRELTNDDGYPVDRGSDWMVQIDSQTVLSSTLSFRFREKRHRTIQDELINGLVRKIQNPLTRTQISVIWTFLSPGWRIKYQRLTLKPTVESKESGQLLVIYLPEMEINRLNVKIGTSVFSTESWNSRIYTWVPGLRGEFLFPAYYETGIEIFSKWNYELTPQTNVSFRHSYMWKNDANLIVNDLLFQFESIF